MVFSLLMARAALVLNFKSSFEGKQPGFKSPFFFVSITLRMEEARVKQCLLPPVAGIPRRCDPHRIKGQIMLSHISQYFIYPKVLTTSFMLLITILTRSRPNCLLDRCHILKTKARPLVSFTGFLEHNSLRYIHFP